MVWQKITLKEQHSSNLRPQWSVEEAIEPWGQALVSSFHCMIDTQVSKHRKEQQEMDIPYLVVKGLYKGPVRLAYRGGRELYWKIKDKRDPAGAAERNAVGGERYKLRSKWAKAALIGRLWNLPPNDTFDPQAVHKYMQQKSPRAYMFEIRWKQQWLCEGAENIYNTIRNNANDFAHMYEILEGNNVNQTMGDLVDLVTDIYNRMQEKNTYRLKMEEALRIALKAIEKEIWMMRMTGNPDVKTPYDHEANGFLGKIVGLAIEGEPYLMGRGKMRQTGYESDINPI